LFDNRVVAVSFVRAIIDRLLSALPQFLLCIVVLFLVMDGWMDGWMM
jgi:hypothetical protein